MIEGPWVGNPPEPEESGLEDYQGQPIHKGSYYIDFDGFRVIEGEERAFADWMIRHYKDEVEDILIQHFMDWGDINKA